MLSFGLFAMKLVTLLEEIEFISRFIYIENQRSRFLTNSFLYTPFAGKHYSFTSLIQIENWVSS